MTRSELASHIDHTLLKPTFTVQDFEEGISYAVQERTASVCIVPWYVKRCAERLAGTGVKTCTVIGFPLGANTTAAKLDETVDALDNGADEIDFVVNVAAVLSGDWDLVSSEIHEITRVVHDAGKQVKVIFENCYLDEAQKIRLCGICSDAEADWVKTSTGFGTGGAVDADLVLMHKHSAPGVQVKAAGGIRTLERVQQILALDAGVTRIGCTATKAILEAL